MKLEEELKEEIKALKAELHREMISFTCTNGRLQYQVEQYRLQCAGLRKELKELKEER